MCVCIGWFLCCILCFRCNLISITRTLRRLLMPMIVCLCGSFVLLLIGCRLYMSNDTLSLCAHILMTMPLMQLLLSLLLLMLILRLLFFLLHMCIMLQCVFVYVCFFVTFLASVWLCFLSVVWSCFFLRCCVGVCVCVCMLQIRVHILLRLLLLFSLGVFACAAAAAADSSYGVSSYDSTAVASSV